MIDVVFEKGDSSIGVENSFSLRMYDDQDQNITLGFVCGTEETEEFIRKLKSSDEKNCLFTFKNIGFALSPEVRKKILDVYARCEKNVS